MKSSNSTDKMSNQNKDRYKSYLIEKLLNENKTNIQQQQQQQQTNGLNDSQEDLTSETGTYVIEDDLNNNNNGGQQSTQPPPSVTLSSIDLKQSTNTIDLMSARAAIDETFGVNQQSTPKRQTQKVIRARNQTYSLTKDLFLSSDKESILTNNNNNNEEIEVEQEQQPTPQSILKKTITYDIIPNHIQDDLNESTVSNVSSKVIGTDILLGDTNQLMEQIKLKRYEKRQSIKARIISANNSLLNQSRSSSSSCSSSLTINNQHDDSIHDTNNQPIKSWTIPCDQEDNIPYDENYFNSSRATVDASQDHSIVLTNQMKNQSRTNGGMAFEFILDDNNNNTSLTNKKNTNYDDNESNLLTNSISSFNSTRRIKPKSDESIMSSSTYSTLTTSTNNNNNLATPKSNTTAMSLGAKIQAKAKENINANNNNNNTSENLDKLKQRNLIRRISSDSSSLQFNNNNNNNNGSSTTPTPPPPPPPSQYMNRTLMLRQQTAKARRNSDNKTDFDSPSLNSINNKTNQVISKQSSTLNSVLKKPTTIATTSNSSSSKTSGNTKSYLNLSNIQTNNSTTVKKNTSRSNSREAINRIQNSSLMTTSLTLPSSQNEQRDALLRRKLYDPVKAVKLDQMKKEEKRKSLLLQEQQQQQQQQQQIIEDNDNSFSTKSLNYSIDENSVSDTLNSFPLQSFHNQTNINRQVNKIIIFFNLKLIYIFYHSNKFDFKL